MGAATAGNWWHIDVDILSTQIEILSNKRSDITKIIYNNADWEYELITIDNSAEIVIPNEEAKLKKKNRIWNCLQNIWNPQKNILFGFKNVILLAIQCSVYFLFTLRTHVNPIPI